MKNPVRGVNLLLLLLLTACSVYAQVTPTDYFRVAPWDYWTATPAYIRMCYQASDGSPIGHCYSNVVLGGPQGSNTRILSYQDNGAYGVIEKTSNGGVVVTRDYFAGQLRCLSGTPGSCASSPLGSQPPFDYVPVLPAVGVSAPTEGAKIYYSQQPVIVNSINPTDCSVSYIGTLYSSGAHFVLASFDFGPQTGILSNIYVNETYAGVPVGAFDPRRGKRMERYFFAPGLGRIRQEGLEDPSCTDDPATCLGNYTSPAPVYGTYIPYWDAAVSPVVNEICP